MINTHEEAMNALFDTQGNNSEARRWLAFEKYRKRFGITDEEIEKRLFGDEPDQFKDEAAAEQWDWDIDKYLTDRYPGGMDWLAYRRAK